MSLMPWGKTLLPMLIIALVILSGFHPRFKPGPATGPGLSITAAIAYSYGGLYDTPPAAGSSYEKNLNLAVDVTLTNTSIDTISYYTMSCSYANFFTTNHPGAIEILMQECYKNIECLQSIPPHTSIIRRLELGHIPQTFDSTYKLQIGMHCLRLKELPAFSDPKYWHGMDLDPVYDKEEDSIRAAAKVAPIVWSNPIDLKRFYIQ